MSAPLTRKRDGSRSLRMLEMRKAGRSTNEIAELMGVQRSTVSNMIARAMRGIRGRSHDDAFDSWGEGEPHCVRCGLRGAHECIDGAVAFLGRRGEQDCGTDTGRRR